MNVVGVSCIMPVLLPAEEISLVNLTPHSCTTLDCPPLKGLHHVERGGVVNCYSVLKVR